MGKVRVLKIVGITAVSILLLIIDINLPLGLAIGISYVLIVLLGWFLNNVKAPIYLAILSSFLTFIGFQFSFKVESHLWIIITNRILTIISIWVVGILLYKIKLKTNKVKKVNHELDVKLTQLRIKNEQLEQFSFIASHDLQEPLRTIISFVKLLEKENNFDSESRKYIKFISESTNRMTDLISSLLEYSKIGANPELKLIDCSSLMSDVVHDIDSKIQAYDAEIAYEKLPKLFGYEIELRQLFQNLISNAIKFSKKEEKPKIVVRSSKKDNHWLFSVSDNGIGIERKYFEKIFSVFQRLHAKNEYEGTGIGLSNCLKIIQLHKGEIWVESKAGEGSTFYFTINQSI